MRSFPGAPSDTPARNGRPSRAQRIAALTAAAVAIGSFAVPAFAKDDEDKLRNEQKQVRSQIHRAEDDLHEASKRVSRAAAQVERTVGRLQAARKQLQRVRVQLRDARVERDRLARQLVVAQERLERVAAELDAAEADVARQRELLRNTVLGMETRGNAELAVMDAITSSGSTKELQLAQTAGTMILGREDQVLDRLEAAEAALQDKKDEVQAARDEVADKKAQARANLERIRGLFADAQTRRTQVARLVDQARHARAVAVRARRADRAALKRLEAREDRIRRQLAALADKAGGPTYNGSTGGFLSRPVNGPVTSPYGYRTHPIYGYYSLHNGTDFGAPCGAPLFAGRSGRVVNTYYDEVYGHRLFLSVGTVNGANLTLVYNHMSGYKVGEGAHVGRGDVVGYVGTTGWSTGCHLHFTVLRNGSPVDPMNYL